MEKEIREIILDSQVKMLEAQLKAVKKMKGGDKEEDKSQRAGMSHIDIVYDILHRIKKELHISEIIDYAQKFHGVSLDRESLVSALSKKVKKGDRFIRTGKNVFSLKGDKL